MHSDFLSLAATEFRPARKNENTHKSPPQKKCSIFKPDSIFTIVFIALEKNFKLSNGFLQFSRDW